MTAPCVLLVEDSPEYARLVELALEGTVRLVGSGSLGNALCALGQERPDVIATDLNLPDAAGPDIVRRLVAAAPDIPVVALSGALVDAARREVLEAGAFAALEKGGELDGTLAGVLVAASESRAS